VGNNADIIFNVVSASGLQAKPVDIMYGSFLKVAEENLPNEYGYMTAQAVQEVFKTPPDYVGRLSLRNTLAALVGEQTGRTTPYTKRQANNLMKQGRVLERARYPVQSIPAIDPGTMQAIVGELVQTPRRNTVPRTSPGSSTPL
jgi:hypothetical protein